MADTPPVPPRKSSGTGRPSGTGTTGTTDTPPRRPAAGRTSSGQGPATSRSKLQKSLEELLAAPALIYAATGDTWAQNHVTTHAPAVAEAWVNLADTSPAVKRVLVKLTTGSAWGGVMVSTGAMVLPLVAHHGLLPAPLAGMLGADTPPPRGPIVPPPPPPPPGGVSGGGTPPPPPPDMTPPLRDGQPPGVVTVVGTNARHTA